MPHPFTRRLTLLAAAVTAVLTPLADVQAAGAPSGAAGASSGAAGLVGLPGAGSDYVEAPDTVRLLLEMKAPEELQDATPDGAARPQKPADLPKTRAEMRQLMPAPDPAPAPAPRANPFAAGFDQIQNPTRANVEARQSTNVALPDIVAPPSTTTSSSGDARNVPTGVESHATASVSDPQRLAWLRKLQAVAREYRVLIVLVSLATLVLAAWRASRGGHRRG